MIRFQLGRVVATPGALSALEKAEQLPAEFLDRHVNGDWGDVPDADKQENEVSVKQGFRVLSAYTTSASATGREEMRRRALGSWCETGSCDLVLSGGMFVRLKIWGGSVSHRVSMEPVGPYGPSMPS